MGRPQAGAAKRTEVFATRFTASEAERIDQLRGELSRSDFMRWLALREVRREAHGQPVDPGLPPLYGT